MLLRNITYNYYNYNGDNKIFTAIIKSLLLSLLEYQAGKYSNDLFSSVYSQQISV